MLLSLSSERDQNDVDLEGVTTGNPGAGIMHGGLINELTQATIKGDWLTLAQRRPEAEARMGRQAFVDVLTVAAAFNGITRVADATGIPLDDDTEAATGAMRATTGIQQFDYAAKSARYDPAAT